MYAEYLNEFRHVAKDVGQFRYEEGHNQLLKLKTLQVVYNKAGTYINNLTLMVFMEKFISGYFLLMSCYELELEKNEEFRSSNN